MGRARHTLLLLAAIPLLMGTAMSAYKRGNMMLSAGRYRLAVQAFRTSLEEDPGFKPAQLGLGRALAGQGHCEGALENLRAVHGLRIWNAQAALSEGDCLHRLGQLDEAEAALEEALLLRPDMDKAWYQLALVRYSRGDECQECLEALSEDIQGANRYWLAQLQGAYEGGDERAWDLLWELRAQQSVTPTHGAAILVQLMEGLLWLDLDHLAEAERILEEGVELAPYHQRTALWLAETLRRQGDPGGADQAIDRPTLRTRPPPLAYALRARILVDQGALQEAAELLEQHPAKGDVEYLASRWYLARARGEDTAPWQRAWRAHPHSAQRSLEQLIPILETP